MDRRKIFQWILVLGDPDRVNIPCLMYGTRLCQTDHRNEKDTSTEHIRYRSITCYNIECMYKCMHYKDICSSSSLNRYLSISLTHKRLTGICSAASIYIAV